MHESFIPVFSFPLQSSLTVISIRHSEYRVKIISIKSLKILTAMDIPGILTVKEPLLAFDLPQMTSSSGLKIDTLILEMVLLKIYQD